MSADRNNSKHVFNRKQSDAKVKRFVDDKDKNRFGKEQHNAKLKLALVKRGIDIEYIFPDNEDIKQEKIKQDNDAMLAHRWSTSTSTSSGSQFLFGAPPWKRGLRSYDLDLNPEVEQLITPANGSLKGDNTNFFDKPIKRCPYSSSICHSKRHSSKKESTIPVTETRSGLTTSTSGETIVSHSLIETQSSSWQVVRKFIFDNAINRMSELMRANHLNQLPWLEERLEMSSRTCRFELPMDVHQLAAMTPLGYLSKHCRVSPEREQSVYRHCFNKNLPDRKMKLLPFARLELCLRHILFDSVGRSDIKKFLKFIHLHHNTHVDVQTFTLLAALAERLLYAGYANMKEQKRFLDPRSLLEIADFSNLSLKIADIQFAYPNLRTLLFSLN